MDFERLILSAIGLCFLVLVACLLSIWLERRRRRSFFTSEFRASHVQPTQKASPTVATLIERKTDGRDHSADHRRQARAQRSLTQTVTEWDRQSNHGMY